MGLLQEAKKQHNGPVRVGEAKASAFQLQNQSFMQAFNPGTSEEDIPAREVSARNPPCNGLGTTIKPNRPIQQLILNILTIVPSQVQ